MERAIIGREIVYVTPFGLYYVCEKSQQTGDSRRFVQRHRDTCHLPQTDEIEIEK